jgi:hypothetical protein
VCEPKGKNPGLVTKPKGGLIDKARTALGGSSQQTETEQSTENMGGMVIFVTNGSFKEEVSRVAWIRRASKNPDVDFATALQRELDKARESVKVLNDLQGNGELH